MCYCRSFNRKKQTQKKLIRLKHCDKNYDLFESKPSRVFAAKGSEMQNIIITFTDGTYLFF